MKNWKNVVWMAAGVAALGIIGGMVGGPAVAQIRAALVRDVDNPALQPFRTQIAVTLLAADSSKTVNGPVVPAGKRLVIENASIWGLTQNADFVSGVWLTVPGANPATFTMLDPASTEKKVVSGSTNIYAYNRPVRLYYEPGETVQAQVFTEGASAGKTVNIYLNGYLVNLQ